MYNCIVITVDVWAYFKAIAIFKFGDVIILVKLMIAHAGYHLLIVLGSPVPERMPGIVVISQVSDVACQDEKISCHLQRVILQVSPVVGKLQMDV